MSSFDVIRRLRRQTGVTKIGHAGTLDPAATGLMLVLLGSATKQARHLVGLDKTYQAEVWLGATSSTGDHDGEITPVNSQVPARAEVEQALAGLVGDMRQATPVYSAVKIHGVRAYKLARAGHKPIMPPRDITVYGINLLGYSYPLVNIETAVSSGTYIRSLGTELGVRLGTGAYLQSLRRTQVGDFRVAQAHQLEDIHPDTLADQLIDLRLRQI